MRTYDEWASRQLGLVTTGQLASSGWTEKQIRHAVKVGRLFWVRSGVLRVAGAPVTQHQAWLAAVLAAPDGTVLSHGTAAALWGFKGLDAPPHIDLLRRGVSRVRFEGIKDHRSVWLPDRDVTRCGSIPVTTPARTLIDACGLVPYNVLKRAESDAARRRLIVRARLVRTFEVMPPSGRRASAPMARLLAELVPGYDSRASDREIDVVKVLKKAGVPVPVLQHPVTTHGTTYHLDFSYPPVMQAFEYEGFTDHGLDYYNFHNDRVRTRRLQRLGWKIWPITSETTIGEIVELFGDAARDAGLW